ncbi:hypothetical protein ACFOZY_05325 [Chungangia koreensis]|uniref:Uncharacterized protein n=2 Tax=Chungangia koreensis TaxID=752657 RepID=A0ABV8X3A5_9LACT
MKKSDAYASGFFFFWILGIIFMKRAIKPKDWAIKLEKRAINHDKRAINHYVSLMDSLSHYRLRETNKLLPAPPLLLL